MDSDNIERVPLLILTLGKTRKKVLLVETKEYLVDLSYR